MANIGRGGVDPTGANVRVAQRIARRKREEEERARITSPGKGVASAYFGKTGALPSPTKFFAFTAAAKQAGLKSPEDYADLFPDWLPIEKADDDEDPASDLIERVHGFFTKRLETPPVRRVSAAAAKSVEARERIDAERETLKKQQARMDLPDEAEREKIWEEGEQRAERDEGEMPVPGPETQRVVEAIKRDQFDVATGGERAAGFFYEDGNPNLPAIRQFARRTGQSNGSIMDPETFTRLRSRFMGRDRDELSAKDQRDLDALARHFATAYGDEFSEKYAWRAENVTWDKHFDKTFSRYIIFANLPYAIYDSTSNAEDKRKAAIANINLASGRDFASPDDDVRAAFGLINSLGDENSPLTAQDQLTKLLYEGWTTAYNPYLAGDRAMFAFAHEFGPEALPREKQQEWSEKRTPWEPHIEAMKKRREAARELGLDEASEGHTAFIESLVGEVESPEAFLEATATAPKPGEGRIGRATKSSFTPTDDFVETHVIPGVVSVMDAVDFLDRGLQRLALVSEMMAKQTGRGITVGGINHLGGVSSHVLGGLGGQRGEAFDAFRRQYGFARTIPIGEETFDPSAWAKAWKEAGEASNEPGGAAYTKWNFKEMGLDPEENKTWVGLSDFYWVGGVSLVADFLVTKGAVTGSKLGLARAARAIMTPKARAASEAAEFELGQAAKVFKTAEEAERMLDGIHASAYTERLRAAAATATKQGKGDIAAKLAKRASDIDNYSRAAAKAEDATAPAWYTPVSDGLAQGTQRGDQVARVLSVDTSGIENQRLLRDIVDVCNRIGASRNAEEIYDLLMWLKGGQARQNLDPGALWLGRVGRYKGVMHASRSGHWAMDPTTGGMRIPHGLENTMHHIEKFGTQWNMGLPKSMVAQAARRRELYIRESWKLQGQISDEAIATEAKLAATKVKGGRGAQVATRRAVEASAVGGRGLAESRQWKLWQEFSKEVGENMERHGATKKQKDAVRKAASRQGEALPDGWDKNMRTVFSQYQFLTSGRAKKLMRGSGQAHRFYDPLAEEAGETGAELIGQMAKDIILPFQPQKLTAFMGNVPGWELWQSTSVVGVPFTSWKRAFELSPNRITGIFRTLVLGRLGFGLNVAIGDEFIRPDTLKAMAKGIASPKRTREMMQLAKEEGQLSRVTADKISDILRTSDDWVQMTVGDPDYPAFFNGMLPQLRGEQLSQWMLALPRAPGEAADDYLLRLRSHIEKELLDNTEAGATLRLQLASEGRDLRGPYRTPGKLDAEKAQYARASQDAFDDLTEITAERERLMAEMAGLREKTRRLTNTPSKGFIASYLRARHAEDTFIDESLPARQVRDLLERKSELQRRGDYLDGILTDKEAAAREFVQEGADEFMNDADLISRIKTEGGLTPDSVAPYVGTGEKTLGHGKRSTFFERQAEAGVPIRVGGRRLDDLANEIGMSEGELWDRLQNIRRKRAKKPGAPRKKETQAELAEVARELAKIDETLAWGKVGGRELTDDEVLSAFAHEWTPKGEKRDQLIYWWKAQQAANRGAGDEYRRLVQIEGQLKDVAERRREIRSRQWKLQRAGAPQLEPGSRLEGWLDRGVERLRFLVEDDELYEAFASGKKMSKKQIAAAHERLGKKGLGLPPVAGGRSGLKYDDGYIWLISETMGAASHFILDRISNGMNKIIFIEHFGKNYDDFIRRGVSKSEAAARAGAAAEQVVDRVLYRHAASSYEYALRNVFLFAPAYRQFLQYWGGVLARHPFLGTHVWQEVAGAPLSINVGDYRMHLPRPFWAETDLGQVGLPGVGPLWLAPLRAANTATGWSQNEDGNYVYTGNTKLDFIGNAIPILSFMNKNNSPMAWVDDIMWGLAGEYMYGGGQALEQDNRLMALLMSAPMSLWRDPMKRRTFAMNIMDAQISAGLKPDFEGAIAEVREVPFWWRPLEWAANPDALLAGASRQLFLNRVQYRPRDIGTKKQDVSVIAELFANDEVRTIADAEFAYLQAYPDPVKTAEVLEKYPRYRAIVDFYKMDARERAEWISEDENLWMLPYVNRRNNYTQDGQLLVAADYFKARKEGQIYRRSMDGYREGWEELAANATWTRALKTLVTDLESGRKNANEFAQEAIRKYAATPEQAERWKTGYKFFAKGWQRDLPGTRYEGGKPEVPGWLVMAARAAGVENKPELWNAAFIQDRYDKMVASAEARTVGPGLGLRPKGAQKGGLEDFWSDAGVQNRDNYDETVGASLKIMDTLKKYASPGYKALFDPQRSLSAGDLADRIKSDTEWRQRRIREVAGQEFWKLSNAADAMLSVGASVPDPDGLNRAAYDIDALWQLYQQKLKGVKEMSDEYKTIRAWHIGERNKVLARPAAAPLRDGPAGRLLQTYLAQPTRGKVDKNFLKHVVAVMGRDNPDYGRLIRNWSDNYWSKDAPPVRAERMQSAAAWASILSVAVDYRRKMAREWNETMGAPGVSPRAKAAAPYVRKLTEYVRVWERQSDKFKRQWEQAGGYDLIEQFLSTGY